MKLSVITIVKDGIKTLPIAIPHNKIFADEYLIIDTGSKDGTRSYLQHFNKKMKVLDYPVPEKVDFAEYRNFGISKATGDWILFLDADEYIPAVMGNQIKNNMKDGFDCYELPIFNFIQPPMFIAKAQFIRGAAKRLFKKTSALKYSGVIHEVAEGFKKSAQLNIGIHHLQYFESEDIDRKTIQYKALMAKKIQEEGYTFLNLVHMGDIYRRRFLWKGEETDLEMAIDYFSQATEKEKTSGVMITLGQLLEIQTQIKESKNEHSETSQLKDTNIKNGESGQRNLVHRASAGAKKV